MDNECNNNGNGFRKGYEHAERAIHDYIDIMKPSCSENIPVNRYELNMFRELMAKDNEISLLKSEQNTEVKIADVYERIMTKVNANEKEQNEKNCAQGIINTKLADHIAGHSAEIAHIDHILNSVTKTVIPKSAICPPVMPRYNFWETPINQAPDVPTAEMI